MKTGKPYDQQLHSNPAKPTRGFLRQWFFRGLLAVSIPSSVLFVFLLNQDLRKIEDQIAPLQTNLQNIQAKIDELKTRKQKLAETDSEFSFNKSSIEQFLIGVEDLAKYPANQTNLIFCYRTADFCRFSLPRGDFELLVRAYQTGNNLDDHSATGPVFERSVVLPEKSTYQLNLTGADGKLAPGYKLISNKQDVTASQVFPLPKMVAFGFQTAGSHLLITRPNQWSLLEPLSLDVFFDDPATTLLAAKWTGKDEQKQPISIRFEVLLKSNLPTNIDSEELDQIQFIYTDFEAVYQKRGVFNLNRKKLK